MWRPVRWRLKASLHAVILGGCLAACACSQSATQADFSVGMSRQNLRGRFGQPIHVQALTKTDTHLFGAVEDLWSRLQTGERVEIWQYRVEGGVVELYFVNGSDSVSELAFVAEGTVF